MFVDTSILPFASLAPVLKVHAMTKYRTDLSSVTHTNFYNHRVLPQFMKLTPFIKDSDIHLRLEHRRSAFGRSPKTRIKWNMKVFCSSPFPLILFPSPTATLKLNADHTPGIFLGFFFNIQANMKYLCLSHICV